MGAFIYFLRISTVFSVLWLKYDLTPRISHLIFTLIFSAKTILGIRLSSSEEGKLVSILDLPGDVLIVPQATLGGRAKGKSMQYHMNIDKESGRSLYQEFCDECKNQILKSPKCQEAGTSFHHGTYGNTQVLKLDTNGPYTHLIEFWLTIECMLCQPSLDNAAMGTFSYKIHENNDDTAKQGYVTPAPVHVLKYGSFPVSITIYLWYGLSRITETGRINVVKTECQTFKYVVVIKSASCVLLYEGTDSLITTQRS